MEEGTWRREHEGGNMEEGTWRREHEECATHTNNKIVIIYLSIYHGAYVQAHIHAKISYISMTEYTYIIIFKDTILKTED